MKQVDVAQFRHLDLSELQEKAKEFKDELFQARFALKTGQLADSSKIRKARRAFAQVQTIIVERSQRAAVGGAA
jgi:large subunit ribosomal protein L29